MKWTSIRITAPYNLGNIGEKKIEAVTKKIAECGIRVNTKINAPDGATILVLNDGRENLVLAPNQLTYIYNMESTEWDTDIAASRVKSALEALLIDDNLNFVFNFEGQSTTNNSHEGSKKIFQDKFNDLPDGIYGVGYRFLIRDEVLAGEIKVEPMINDSALYYYQFIFNLSSSKSIERAVEIAKAALDSDYTSCLEFVKEK